MALAGIMTASGWSSTPGMGVCCNATAPRSAGNMRRATTGRAGRARATTRSTAGLSVTMMGRRRARRPKSMATPDNCFMAPSCGRRRKAARSHAPRIQPVVPTPPSTRPTPMSFWRPPDGGRGRKKANPKPQAKHKKPDATPVAQPAANPADAKPAPVAAQPPANPQPANPQAAVSPEAATPAAPAPGVAAAKPEPSNPRPAANPQAAITPPVATPARPVSARPSTPAPRVADIKQEPLGTQRAANPPAAITPPVAMPARPVVSAHQSTPATPAPRVADTKPVAAPAPETAAAAPPAKPTRPKPVLNDVPVAPLE